MIQPLLPRYILLLQYFSWNYLLAETQTILAQVSEYILEAGNVPAVSLVTFHQSTAQGCPRILAAGTHRLSPRMRKGWWAGRCFCVTQGSFVFRVQCRQRYSEECSADVTEGDNIFNIIQYHMVRECYKYSRNSPRPNSFDRTGHLHCHAFRVH